MTGSEQQDTPEVQREDRINGLTALRRELHTHPELSGREYETQKRIRLFLEKNGYSGAQTIGGTGLLCPFHFGDGPSLLIRVDIDALAIGEVNTFEHRSQTPGVSHKCGHDGHTAIGCGTVLALLHKPLPRGTVYVLFQPAEETGEGARAVIGDPLFATLKTDFAVSLHNIPGAPLHQVLWKNEGFTPAVQSLIIRLKGKTSHAAEPHRGINPAYAIADIIQQAAAIENTDQQQADFSLVTPVYSTLGSKDYGISAGYGEVHFTIRSWAQATMESVTALFKQRVQEIASRYHLVFETEITAVFAANFNNRRVVEEITRAAENLGLNSVMKKEPFPWGEDFGLFTQTVPGAMFGLGSGESTPALHNPDYDYPDEITETGVSLFYEIAKNICSA